MSHFRKILVPVDGSPASLAALDEAVTLAEEVDGDVAVLEVNPTASLELEAAVASARDRLQERLTRRTEVGEPVKRILEVAAEERPGVIVIGTHGRVGRLHALVGSVAESVVRNAPCPVLTVRHPVGDEESFGERIHHRSGIARSSQ